jgi:hypothetical protein
MTAKIKKLLTTFYHVLWHFTFVKTRFLDEVLTIKALQAAWL